MKTLAQWVALAAELAGVESYLNGIAEVHPVQEATSPHLIERRKLFVRFKRLE
jgi:hypothetical protein